MAIVLEVSLTLNPNNQIAYLADFTTLVDNTEYVISGTYLTFDTRFLFRGNLDITLTKPPIGVPVSGTVIPATVSTVPQAAPAPPPAIYPYSVKDRVLAYNLNNDLEFSPGPVPPHSALGGAGHYKYWVDTSTAPATIRQCVVARASVGYVATDWVTVGTVDASGFKVTGLNALYTELTKYVLKAGDTMSGPLTVPYIHYSLPAGIGNNYFSFGWDGHTRVYVDGAGPYGTVPSSLPIPVSEGGTGSTTAAQALINLGGLSTAGGSMGGLTTTGLTVNGGSGLNGDVTVTGNFLAGNSQVAALTASQEHVYGLFGVDGLTTLNTLNVNGNAHFIGACQVDHGVQYPAYGLANAATNIGFGYSYNSPTVLWMVANDNFAGTILVNTSDERLKQNIQPITVDPLASLRLVQLKSFDLVTARNDPADVATHYDVGFIAQQLVEAVPDAVIEPPPDMEDAYLSVDLMPLVAYCVGAIQQLAARLEALEGA